MVLLRYADVALVVIGVIVAIVLGAPVLGCAVGGGAWIVQTVVAVIDARWTAAQRDPVRRVGVAFVERFGRIWLLAGGIVIAGIAGGRADGLAAAVTIFVAYSVAFAIKIAGGPPQERAS